MPERNYVDLSHFSFDRGFIGSLQTMACIPIVAGDSLSVNLEGIWRLSPLRRNLVVDCHIDMFAFFVPHRHVYGEDWITFIKDGKNGTVVFPEITVTSAIEHLGTHYEPLEVIPQWPLSGYNRIWNRYFRSPSDLGNERDDTYQTPDVEELVNGYRCGYLPTPWSTGVLEPVPDSEREVPVVLDTFDIVDLNRVQAEYRTEVDRAYFGFRYNDLLNTTFGSTVNTDADERPTLCGHSKFWLSGYDVDGTDDASLGSYSGKSAGVGRFGIKRKYFSEHGALFIMCLPRFPTIHTEERHFLAKTPQPSYLDISGDPSLVGAEPPETLLREDYFHNAAAAGPQGLGVGPFGQWYRYHPNHVHDSYQVLDGWTFLDAPIDGPLASFYHEPGEFTEVFQTTQLGHWQSHVRIDVHCNRVVPKARGSLYQGG